MSCSEATAFILERGLPQEAAASGMFLILQGAYDSNSFFLESRTVRYGDGLRHLYFDRDDIARLFRKGMSKFGWRMGTRWRVDSQVFLYVLQILHRDPEQFRTLLCAARNKKEFITFAQLILKQ